MYKLFSNKRSALLIIAAWSSALAIYATQTPSSDTLSNVDTRMPNYIRSYQRVDKDEVMRRINNSQAFSPGKENYLSTGAPLDDEFNKEKADVKGQIDLRYRLTKDIMPFQSYLLLNYRQTSFWHIFGKSMNHNFNPSIGLSKILFKGDRVVGRLSLMAEHESNGKDSISRNSWNNVSLTAVHFFNPRLHFEGKVWYPFGVGREITDLMKYRGYGYLAIKAIDRSEMVRISAIVNPRAINNGLNLTLDMSFRLSRNDNRYIFFQYYKGYAEELLHYKEYHSMLRAGFCIKEDFTSLL